MPDDKVEFPDVIELSKEDKVYIRALVDEIRVQQQVQQQCIDIIEKAKEAQVILQRALGASQSLQRLVQNKALQLTRDNKIPDTVFYELNPDTGILKKVKEKTNANPN